MDQVFEQMKLDREIDPSLNIPKSFVKVYKRPEFTDLLECFYEYLNELFRIEKYQIERQLEAEKRGLDPPSYGFWDSQKLQLKAKQIAQQYINFIQKMIFQKRIVADLILFETIIYFAVRVLQQKFPKDLAQQIDTEINRLLRTDSFNISQRFHTQRSRIEQFPFLDLPVANETTLEVVQRVEKRLFATQIKTYTPRIEIRPGVRKVSPFRALNSRSPLVSLIFPDATEKVRMHEMQALLIYRERKRQMRFNISTKHNIVNIVKQELTRRAGLNAN